MTRFIMVAIIALGAVTAVPTAAQAEEPVAKGEWQKKNFRIDGTWSIVSEGDRYYVVLDDRFKTRNAPDLKLFLSPLSADEVGNRNATSGSVLVSPLDSNKGAQRYALPEGVNPDDFQSIVLHCEQFSKLWGAADLK